MIGRDLQKTLRAFRKSSNSFWARHQERSLAEFQASNVGGSTWRTDTQWKDPLTDGQLDEIEREWGVDFPQDYRCFLRELNAPDRSAKWYLFEGSEIQSKPDRNIFVDWQSGRDDGDRAYQTLLESILFDVEHGVWLDGWGTAPKSLIAKQDHVTKLFYNAPRLVPFYGHRFFVSGLELSPAPVLSIYQTDAIVYGWSIESVLQQDFSDLLGGTKIYPPAIEAEQNFKALAKVPFWGEFLMTG